MPKGKGRSWVSYGDKKARRREERADQKASQELSESWAEARRTLPSCLAAVAFLLALFGGVTWLVVTAVRQVFN